MEKIRTKIGSGSPNTVGPLLDRWWKSLAARLDQGPAAFHRLPESVSHIAEALWLRALDEAWARATLEQSIDQRGVAQNQERLEVRSQVLSLREAEMQARISESEKANAELQIRVQLLARSLRREQAARNELERKLNALESKPLPKANATAVKSKARSSKPKTIGRALRKTSLKGKRKPRRTTRKGRRP
ncbi:MAG: DNA-binding protein [Pseudomonadota bacterium]|nr:DNA-binding protein [Pseudomonadota bacterium]